MNRIKIKPLSVNRAWKGQRFRSKFYESFSSAVNILLTQCRKPKLSKEGKLFAHFRWGVSNMGADVDNPCKPFQDILFDDYLKENDKRVTFLILEKHKTPKKKEFIDWHVGEKEQLISYLEGIIETLKKEKE